MDANLIHRFREAGLELRPALAPLEPASPERFQIDIRRLGPREHFRVWPGRGTSIDVLSVDRALRQVALRVREAARRGRRTPGTSSYLCGVDDRRLFVARLNGGAAPRGPSGKPLRRGEWTFLPMPEADRERLEALIAGRRAVVLADEPLPGAGGASFTAEQLVRVPAPAWAADGRGPGIAVFVRGALRHAEHGTVRLGAWRTALRFAEGQARPVYWIG
jgi:hypothetical protein